MGSLAGRLLYAGWGLLWGTATTAFHALLYMGVFGIRRPGWAPWVERSFARSLLGGLGVRLEIQGQEHIPPGRSFVAVSNHQSYLDIPALFLSLRPATVVFVAKRELGRIPFLGWAIAASHHIMVDRGNREQAVVALQESMRRIRSGVALGVFAEGTRSPDLRLLPFKKGGFYVAVDSRLPIVPVSLSGSGRIFGKRTKLPRRGVIHVRIHEGITPGPGGRADIPRLLATVREAVQSGVPEAGAEHAERARGSPRPRTPGGFRQAVVGAILGGAVLGVWGEARGTPWDALDQGVERLARQAGFPAERLRVDAAALELEDTFPGRLRLERYLLAEPRRAPATLDALAEELIPAKGAAGRLDLLSRLAWSRPGTPRPLEIEHVRLPTDTLENPVVSAMERLYAGTGKRFQGIDRDRVAQESGRLPAVYRARLAVLLDAIARANRLREAVARSSDLKQGGAFESKSRKTASRLREVLLRWGEPDLVSDEAMSHLVYSLGTVHLDVLYAAGVDLAAALDEAGEALGTEAPAVPPLQFEWPTPWGRIGVGGGGDNTFRGDFALVLDTGGNDVYRGPGGTSGEAGAALVLDLAGNDRYEPADSAMVGPGGAILGYAGVVDLRGDDTYLGAAWSAGFGFLGIGWIRDEDGDDRYRMQWQSQGFGFFGIGLLLDESGDDDYSCTVLERGFPLGQGQGFGGPQGLGLLLDLAGRDMYLSRADSIAATWMSAETVVPGGLVQGASLGAGDRWAGGLGCLVDGGGEDRYEAPGEAQGYALGAGLGILADRGGDDEYRAGFRAQGSGNRLGVGLLLDSAGDDVYLAGSSSLGAGVDLGLGMLADGAGADRYDPGPETGNGGHGPGGAGNPETTAPASAVLQGAGWLLDGGGEDQYPASLLEIEPGSTDPWRSPVPGVVVWIDLEQSPGGIPGRLLGGTGNPHLGEDAGAEGEWRLLPWRGSGPGAGGGLVRIRSTWARD